MPCVRDIQQNCLSHPEVPEVWLRSTTESLQPYACHSHSEFSLGLIVGGSTRFSLAGQEHAATVGDVVLIPPHTPHACNPLPGGSRSYHMLFAQYDWCIRRTGQRPGKIPYVFLCPQPVVRSTQLEACYREVVAAFAASRAGDLQQGLETLFDLVFARYCQPQPCGEAEHPLAAQIAACLLADLARPPSIQTLAGQFALRRETLIRLFERHTGFSPWAFVNNARMERAKSLLQTGVPIADIAQQLGFADQSHFHKTFTRYAAATPGQFQQVPQQQAGH